MQWSRDPGKKTGPRGSARGGLMPRGGARAGAGRPKKLRSPLKAYIGETGMPRDYMLAVMRDPEADPARRDKMAIELLPYYERRLSPLPADPMQPELPLPKPEGPDISPARAAWDGLVH